MTTATACVALLSLAVAFPCPAQTRPASAPKSLARYVPAKDLIFYVEFDGLAAHMAAWKKSALYKLLNETKFGALVEDLGTQALEQAIAAGPEKGRPKTSDVTGGLKALVRDGFVIGMAGNPPQPPVGVFAVRNAAKNGILNIVRLIDAEGGKTPKTERRGSRTVTLQGEGPQASAWWLEGDDLVRLFAGAAAYNEVVAAIEGKAPNAATNAIRNEGMKAEPGFEPVGTAFFDISKIPMPPDAARSGLDGLKRIDYRVGFQDEALFSVLRVVAPAPRHGVLAWFEQPTFEKTALPPIPAGLSSWTVFSFAPGKLWSNVIAWTNQEAARMGRPPGAPPPGIVMFEQGVQQNLGIRIKEDFLDQLGPKWVFYLNGETPPQRKAIGKVRAALTAEIRDPGAFARTVDKVMGIVMQTVQAQAAQNPQARVPQIQKLAGPTPGYRLVLPPGSLPPQAEGLVDPTILIGKKQFVLGITGAEARAALTGGKTWTPGPEYATPFAKLPKDLIALSVDDPRAILPPLVEGIPQMIPAMNAAIAGQTPPGKPKFALKLDPSKVPTADEVSRRLFPNTMAVTLDREGLKVTSRESIPSITGVGGVAVGTALLLPAVQAAREAARRAQCVNDLKQIGLALHNYHDVNNALPAAAITGKDGKPLLSWRVAILPFIEAQGLYNEFHLDEPWDSPHNKTLIAKMPRAYVCPSSLQIVPGTTTYKAFVGGGALFDPTKPVGFQQVTDGTSNTMAVVEGKTPVIWTKPEDIPFDPKAPPSLLDAGSNHPGGFNVLFTDGSVQFIKITINLQTFRALITRAMGEVVGADSF
jgi:prepilin-type processing-associated H-X9-DG protein